VIPVSIQANVGQLYNMLHPSLASVQSFLGYAHGRPTAPFSYTNEWGNCLAMLLPWLFVVWWAMGDRRHRWWAAIMLALAFVPAIYTLDRGLWVGVGVGVIYLALRFAARGKLAMLGGIAGVLIVAALVILASPLQNLIADRYTHGQSNTGRLNLTGIAIDDAIASPVIGYGDTRHELGSAASIAVGRNANCKHCGNQIVGGNGQMQMLLIADGLVGAALYFGFFAYGAWRYRRDKTPYGITGVMIILMSFVYMGVYNAVGPPLIFLMLAYALLWKNDRELRSQRALAAEAAAAENGVAAQARSWRAITARGV
jgi:O-Antigen ligase